MRKAGLGLAGLGVLALAGCQYWPFRATPTPAHLVAPTPACLSALSDRARQWTGKPVVLTPAAFATDARLVLEQPALPGPDGRRLNGRIVEPPRVLTLVRVGRMCRVVHPDGNEEANLPDCACAPLAPTSGPGMVGDGSAAPPAVPPTAPAPDTPPLPPLPPGVGPGPGVS